MIIGVKCTPVASTRMYTQAITIRLSPWCLPSLMYQSTARNVTATAIVAAGVKIIASTVLNMKE